MRNLILLLFAGILFTACDQSAGEKTAFIDNVTLHENLESLKASTERFEKKLQDLEEEAQQESQKFQLKVQDFQEKMQTMSEEEAEKSQQKLIEEQQRLQNALGHKENELREELNAAQDSLEGVVKDKVKQIAKSKNYTYVFGVNEDFNIHYAKDSNDITQEVLDALNNEK